LTPTRKNGTGRFGESAFGRRRSCRYLDQDPFMFGVKFGAFVLAQIPIGL